VVVLDRLLREGSIRVLQVRSAVLFALVRYLAHTLSVPHTFLAPQRRPFSGRCLPLTVELAQGLKDDLLGELGSANAAWCFDDRLLAWLHPSFEATVRRYYSEAGTTLEAMFDAQQCQRLDQLLLGLLIQRLDTKSPGLASALGFAAGLPVGAEQDEPTGRKNHG
jgi:hypothetical protein